MPNTRFYDIPPIPFREYLLVFRLLYYGDWNILSQAQLSVTLNSSSIQK